MKIAVVTGASSGFGMEFVKQLNHCYRSLDEIWVIARRGERLCCLKDRLQIPVKVLEGDLLEDSFFQKFEQLLEGEHPDIRMLVNSAGFGKSGTVEQILQEDKELQLRMISLNCTALTRMTIICLPYLSKGSRILQLASAAAFCPQAGFSVYSATKSYVLSFSRSLGEELKERGIIVTAVCPGPSDTEFFRVSGELTNPLKRLTMAKPSKVVTKALRDSRKKKAVSVYGIPMRFSWIASKLMPHGFILKIMNRH